MEGEGLLPGGGEAQGEQEGGGAARRGGGAQGGVGRRWARVWGGERVPPPWPATNGPPGPQAQAQVA